MAKTQSEFDYSPWRHGGWYVNNVRYPSGAIGCVSRNYDDGKWRIACDPRPFAEQPTFRNRDAAARGERDLIAHLSAAAPGLLDALNAIAFPYDGVTDAQLRHAAAGSPGSTVKISIAPEMAAAVLVAREAIAKAYPRNQFS
ncbi:MAG: hypothetical protein V4527_18965 [Pseudomonadota bacterium]